jgi:hypothetical protein
VMLCVWQAPRVLQLSMLCPRKACPQSR